VLGEVGLDGLTMRRLADQLGVKAASLYWHVQDKGELLGLLAEAISAEVRGPDPGLPWRDQLVAMAWEMRQVLLAHRDAAQILASTPPIGLERLRLIEMGLRILRAAGLRGAAVGYAARLLNDYITLSVAEETVFVPAQFTEDVGLAELEAAIRTRFATLPAAEYPTIVALADTLATSSAEAQFRFGLEVLLDGLTQQLGREA
jgi:TetR/AcrR family tetracycline transcriptional repressor